MKPSPHLFRLKSDLRLVESCCKKGVEELNKGTLDRSIKDVQKSRLIDP